MEDYQVCGYTYRADEWCPNHAVRAVLAREGLQGHGLSYVASEALDLMARFRGIRMDDEYSYDTDEWPKVILGYQAEDADSCCCVCGVPLRDSAPTWDCMPIDTATGIGG